MMHFTSDSELNAAEWPFDCDPHTGTFVSRCVVKQRKSSRIMIEKCTPKTCLAKLFTAKGAKDAEESKMHEDSLTASNQKP